jgi:hypothetical protein
LDFFADDRYSRIKIGMEPYEVWRVFGEEGKDVKNVPPEWPRALGEVPDFEKILQRAGMGPVADRSYAREGISWKYWKVRGPERWIAVGLATTNNRGGSLTMPEVVIKKSGLECPDFRPE